MKFSQKANHLKKVSTEPSMSEHLNTTSSEFQCLVFNSIIHPQNKKSWKSCTAVQNETKSDADSDCALCFNRVCSSSEQRNPVICTVWETATVGEAGVAGNSQRAF